MVNNISELKNNSNNEEENVIRSLGHNALVELLNNNNNEIENECVNELQKKKNDVNEINLFEINDCVISDSTEKKRKKLKCSSTKLLNKLSYNKLNENKIDILNYDNNLNTIKTECSRHNYFNAIDKNDIFFSDKSQNIFMHDHIKKNMNKNLIKINSMNRNIACDPDLHSILKRKRKVESEMLENNEEYKNDMTRIEKKKKDLIYFNTEDYEIQKKRTSENCNNLNHRTQNYNKTSEKKKDNISDNNLKNSTQKSTPKTRNNNSIFFYSKKTVLEINDINTNQEENNLIENEENLNKDKNKIDNKNNIEMVEYYEVCTNKDVICNENINNSSKKKEHNNFNMNNKIINENKEKDRNRNNDQCSIKKKEEILKLNDENMGKNENNSRLDQEKRDIDKYIIKIEERNVATDKENLIKNDDNLKNSKRDKNVLKDIHMEKAINSENFIFLDFNPIEEDYLEIKKELKNYKKNYHILYSKEENIDNYINSKSKVKDTYIKNEKVNTPNLEQIQNREPFYIRKKYNYLKDTLLKKKISIINYDFENNLCYVLIKKNSTL